MDFAQTPQPVLTAATSSYAGERLPCVALLGLQTASVGVADALAWLGKRMARRVPTRVSFLNAHCGNLVRRVPAYRRALESADAVLPDGSGVALAARMKGIRLAANLNGTDFVPQLCAQMAGAGQSVFLLGGRPGVAQAAAEALQLAHPGLTIAGSRHGYFGPEGEQEVIAEVNSSGADLLLVALGVPEQDLWLQRVAPFLAPPVTMGVGALFDFLSHGVPRAPAVLRRAGLEWTYRLYQEPRRMWRRYLVGNLTFLAHAMLDPGKAAASHPASREPIGKRSLDITVAAAVLLAAAPLLAVAALAIRLTTPGPAILRQTRIGKNGVPFTLYKLRSMYYGATLHYVPPIQENHHGADAVTFKVKRDTRITPLGRWLRRSSIDEFPQLWNVLIGEMSLVGPRPPLPHEVERYTTVERQRLTGLPGLTCLWQVSGRADLPFDRQVELDLKYLSKRSLMTDLHILWRTIPAVLTARGAY